MTSPIDSGHSSDLTAARVQAAELFAAAARNEKAGTTAQLHCITALTALRAPSGPLPAAAPTPAIPKSSSRRPCTSSADSTPTRTPKRTPARSAGSPCRRGV